MKIKICEKVYDAASLDALSLKMLLQLEQETLDFGHQIRANDIRRISTEITALKTDEERINHPESLWLTAVTIWASRKVAGETVTFDQAVDFPVSEMTFMPGPEDHKPDPRKPRARKGSGAAVSHRPRPPKTKTSAKRS